MPDSKNKSLKRGRTWQYRIDIGTWMQWGKAYVSNELSDRCDGRNARNDKVWSTIQLSSYGKVLLLIEPQVDGVVDGAGHDAIASIEELGIAVGRVRHLLVHHIEVVCFEETQLVSYRVCGSVNERVIL